MPNRRLSVPLRPSQSVGVLQRQCACGGGAGLSADAECPECAAKRETAMQRKAAGAAAPVNTAKPASAPPVVHDVLKSSGSPLDAGTRTFMESRFGHDFSDVRVHTDSRAAESAQAVDALAYTVGQNIVFGTGKYAPTTQDGRKILAHELTHTVQQDAGSPVIPSRLEVSNRSDRAEQEAEATASALTQGEQITPVQAFGPQLSRQDALDTGAANVTPPDTSTANVAPPAAGQPSAETAPAPTESAGATSAAGACTPAAGIPSSDCSAYAANAWWLPAAYIVNATCACMVTPNDPTASCVRKFLQDRLAAYPTALKATAAGLKASSMALPTSPTPYDLFVQTVLTPQIYQDHVDAYRSCCCPSGPAPYVDWMAVTAIPNPVCSLTGWFINRYGSCHGTPGAW
ncbi:MAG TPA: DUF4157 domain-containing protein [Chthonomonadaceae bacterium]|nr:DUF4157 domain-containing protein [Chthonomonadaceae bacterium]